MGQPFLNGVPSDSLLNQLVQLAPGFSLAGRPGGRVCIHLLYGDKGSLAHMNEVHVHLCVTGLGIRNKRCLGRKQLKRIKGEYLWAYAGVGFIIGALIVVLYNFIGIKPNLIPEILKKINPLLPYFSPFVGSRIVRPTSTNRNWRCQLLMAHTSLWPALSPYNLRPTRHSLPRQGSPLFATTCPLECHIPTLL